MSKEQKKEAAEWIRSDPDRRRRAAELASTVAPREFRAPGQINDEGIEPELPPLPFAEVVVPTLIAHGTNDGRGHHALPLCRNYAPLAARQIELALG